MSKGLMFGVLQIAETLSELCQTSKVNLIAKNQWLQDEFKTLLSSEMELFPQVVTGSRGELRILQNAIWSFVRK